MDPYALAQNGKLGVNPTPRQKLLTISQEAGLDLRKMQGTTANRYDTVTIVDSANPQVLEFFVNTSDKVRQFTNYQRDLKAGEAIICEYVMLSLLELDGADLNDPTTAITASQPLGQTVASVPFTSANMIMETANGTRIREFGLEELNPWNNPINCGIAASTIDSAVATEAQTIRGANYIRLEANPIILPNNNFVVRVQVGPLSGLPANSAVKLTVGRFGSIYSANQPL